MIAVGERDHDPFVQAHDELCVTLAYEGIEEPDLERAGIGKEVIDAGSLHLGDDELTAGAGHLDGSLASFRCLQRRDQGLCRGSGETKSREGFEESATRKVVIQVTGDQVTHDSPPRRQATLIV